MGQAKFEDMVRLYEEFKPHIQLDAETNRNIKNSDLFEEMIREGYSNVSLVATGHHFLFKTEDQKIHGEIPSADTLIFDHSVAQRLWKDKYKEVLVKLALEPTESRDQLLRNLYYNRT